MQPEITLLEQVINGFKPRNEILRKIRSRCAREMDHEADGKVVDLARQLKVIMRSEKRKNILFDIQYSGVNTNNCEFSTTINTFQSHSHFQETPTEPHVYSFQFVES